MTTMTIAVDATTHARRRSGALLAIATLRTVRILPRTAIACWRTAPAELAAAAHASPPLTTARIAVNADVPAFLEAPALAEGVRPTATPWMATRCAQQGPHVQRDSIACGMFAA